MSSVMYTGGSGEGPICDFHIRSDQRKLGKIKGGGRVEEDTLARATSCLSPPLFLKYIFLLPAPRSGESPASYVGSRGNSGAPRAAILEASSGTASQVEEGSSEGDGERDKGEC